MVISQLASIIPSVIKPAQRLTFKDKAKWTLIILAIYFFLGSIILWGINPDAVAQFEFYEIIFGSKMGSLITLGIGPIVTASIILQLLIGSKILNWDIKSEEGKAKFMSTQKILSIIFAIVEAIAYVFAGAIPPANSGIFLAFVVIAQLVLGAILIMFMDEVCSKWGFGSGISLFIAAGVSKTIFLRIFSPPLNDTAGGILFSTFSNLGQGAISMAAIGLIPLISTIFVFFVAVFAQAIRVEVPMAFAMPFGKFAARKWPLKFFYTSNIPVILTAAVLANVQVVGRLLSSSGITALGTFDATSGQATSGILYYISSPNAPAVAVAVIIAGVCAIIGAFAASTIWKKYIIRTSAVSAVIGLIIGVLVIYAFNLPVLTLDDAIRAALYISLMVGGSILFSYFWMQTSGMDSHTVSEQFKSSSIVIPGFRHDPRIVERVLDRYIPALTILGGAAVGLLAGFADLTMALGTGTGILLTVMIIIQFYEQIASQHMEDMNPALRKFMGGA